MFRETISVWRYLKETSKPVIIYGMGDGAEKILKVFEQYEIAVSGFMASDEFVRGHEFRGFKVMKLSEIEEIYENFIIIIAFGTSRDDVLERIYSIAERYEVYAPDVPVYGTGLFNEEYIAENFAKIKGVRDILADEPSKIIFDRLIDYRLTGRIDILKSITSPRAEAMSLLEIKADGSETFVDLGAYNGDTVEEFLELTEKCFNKIYALEPDTRSFLKLKRRHYQLGGAKFMPINAAAWHENTMLEFSDKGGRNSSVQNQKRLKPIEAKTVNSICKNDKVTLIKMDVEGSEANALNGASEVIKRFKPRLIIAEYHRTEDMLELPLLIKRLEPKYKIYLRHHGYIPAWDTNFYCI